MRKFIWFQFQDSCKSYNTQASFDSGDTQAQELYRRELINRELAEITDAIQFYDCDAMEMQMDFQMDIEAYL